MTTVPWLPDAAAAPRAATLLALALAASGAAGCDGPPTQDDDRDIPLYRAEPELTIGSFEGEGADVFGRVSGIAMDDAGRIYVADMHAHEIRVFDDDGNHRFTLGRQGAGPGELSGPCCLAFGPDGRLWVRDNGNARYVAFDVGPDGGTPAGTERMRHGDANRHVTTTFDEAGRVIDVGMRADPASGEHRTYRFHIRPGGDVEAEVPAPQPQDPGALVHAVTVRRGDATIRRFFYQPYGPLHRVAHGPDGMHADAITSTYEVRWFASDGSLLHTISRPGETGPPLTGEQRQRADSVITADVRSTGSPMPFDIPQHHPPLAALHFDETGRLWVRRTTLPDQPQRFDVYDREGVLVQRVEIPAGFSLSYGVLRPDLVVGVTRDELGVDYVSRLVLRPSP